MNDTVIDESYNGWYVARVIGKGNSRGTLELLFDDGHWHARSPLFTGARDEESGLATGAVAIKVLTEPDFTWDSEL